VRVQPVKLSVTNSGLEQFTADRGQSFKGWAAKVIRLRALSQYIERCVYC